MHEGLQDTFIERVGKVKQREIYSTDNSFMIMFPNDYSLIAKELGDNGKYVSIKVLYGVADFTHKFFRNKKKSRKVNKRNTEKLISSLSSL